MDVNILTQENITIIIVEGSIDSRTAGDLQMKIMEGISDSNYALLDFKGVDFVSSAGLRVLLMLYRHIKSKNGKIVLTGVSEEIREVMEMTGFINFFELSDKVEDAMILFK
jgi:anti-sigma B factor antagonist